MKDYTVSDIAKLLVVITLCLALLGCLALAYAGKVDASTVVTFVLTAFASLAGGAAGVGLTQYGSKQGVNTALNVMSQTREK